MSHLYIAFDRYATIGTVMHHILVISGQETAFEVNLWSCTSSCHMSKHVSSIGGEISIRLIAQDTGVCNLLQ